MVPVRRERSGGGGGGGGGLRAWPSPWVVRFDRLICLLGEGVIAWNPCQGSGSNSVVLWRHYIISSEVIGGEIE